MFCTDTFGFALQIELIGEHTPMFSTAVGSHPIQDFVMLDERRAEFIALEGYFV